jgi:hypothetical protein
VVISSKPSEKSVVNSISLSGRGFDVSKMLPSLADIGSSGV